MIIPIPFPNSIHVNRQFCTVLDESYLKHIDSFSLEVYHNGKKVKAGIDKDTQKQGNPEIYYLNEINEEYQQLKNLFEQTSEKHKLLEMKMTMKQKQIELNLKEAHENELNELYTFFQNSFFFYSLFCIIYLHVVAIET